MPGASRRLDANFNGSSTAVWNNTNCSIFRAPALPAQIRFKDIHLAIGPAHHMVNGLRRLESELARQVD